MTIKPSSMPRKTNPIRIALLGSLIETREGKRPHKVWDAEANGGKGEVIQSTVSTGPALRWPLAQNVSSRNVEVLAKRWIA